MLLRSLALACLLVALLAPVAAADEDNDGHDGHDGQQASSTSLSFASGSTGVSVTPPGGSAMAAVTCTNQPSFWVTISGAQWISTNADCTTAVATGNFTYSLSFMVPSGATNLNLNVTAVADDSVSVALNGNNVPMTSGSGGLNSVSTFSTTSGFQTGATNTLTFTVNNAGGASGLDFTASVTGTGVGGQVAEEGGHGQCVSAVAHDAPHGRGHGQAVSNAAHSCSGHGSDEEDD